MCLEFKAGSLNLMDYQRERWKARRRVSQMGRVWYNSKIKLFLLSFISTLLFSWNIELSAVSCVRALSYFRGDKTFWLLHSCHQEWMRIWVWEEHMRRPIIIELCGLFRQNRCHQRVVISLAVCLANPPCPHNPRPLFPRRSTSSSGWFRSFLVIWSCHRIFWFPWDMEREWSCVFSSHVLFWFSLGRTICRRARAGAGRSELLVQSGFLVCDESGLCRVCVGGLIPGPEFAAYRRRTKIKTTA